MVWSGKTSTVEELHISVASINNMLLRQEVFEVSLKVMRKRITVSWLHSKSAADADFEKKRVRICVSWSWKRGWFPRFGHPGKCFNPSIREIPFSEKIARCSFHHGAAGAGLIMWKDRTLEWQVKEMRKRSHLSLFQKRYGRLLRLSSYRSFVFFMRANRPSQRQINYIRFSNLRVTTDGRDWNQMSQHLVKYLFFFEWQLPTGDKCTVQALSWQSVAALVTEATLWEHPELTQEQGSETVKALDYVG